MPDVQLLVPLVLLRSDNRILFHDRPVHSVARIAQRTADQPGPLRLQINLLRFRHPVAASRLRWLTEQPAWVNTGLRAVAVAVAVARGAAARLALRAGGSASRSRGANIRENSPMAER